MKIRVCDGVLVGGGLGWTVRGGSGVEETVDLSEGFHMDGVGLGVCANGATNEVVMWGCDASAKLHSVLILQEAPGNEWRFFFLFLNRRECKIK